MGLIVIKKNKWRQTKLRQKEEIPPPELTTEDAQTFRNLHKSKVTGDDIPIPIGSFQDMIGRFHINKKYYPI